jgi:hypothetical protein
VGIRDSFWLTHWLRRVDERTNRPGASCVCSADFFWALLEDRDDQKLLSAVLALPRGESVGKLAQNAHVPHKLGPASSAPVRFALPITDELAVVLERCQSLMAVLDEDQYTDDKTLLLHTFLESERCCFSLIVDRILARTGQDRAAIQRSLGDILYFRSAPPGMMPRGD